MTIVPLSTCTIYVLSALHISILHMSVLSILCCSLIGCSKLIFCLPSAVGQVFRQFSRKKNKNIFLNVSLSVYFGHLFLGIFLQRPCFFITLAGQIFAQQNDKKHRTDFEQPYQLFNYGLPINIKLRKPMGTVASLFSLSSTTDETYLELFENPVEKTGHTSFYYIQQNVALKFINWFMIMQLYVYY